MVIRAEKMPEIYTAMNSQHIEKHFSVSVLNKSRKKINFVLQLVTVKEQLQSAESHQVAIVINIGQIPPAAGINTLPLSRLPCKKQ